MKESRRYILTSDGSRKYITEEDIRTETYCDVCENPLAEDHIYLQLRGGWAKRRHGIPNRHDTLLLHEECTPPMILGLMEPLSEITVR